MDSRKGAYENGVFVSGAARLLDLSGSRSLPIGNSVFSLAAEKSVVVDKSLLIADILRSGSTATLFCRPRRFGKSLNLSMLQAFFEAPNESDPSYVDSTPVFSRMAIWEEDEGSFRTHHGTYPVVRMSFGNTKSLTWTESREMIAECVRLEATRHRYLLASSKLSVEEKALLSTLMEGAASDGELAASLLNLTIWLFKHHGNRAVVLIDEYDAPVMTGYDQGYYQEVVMFMKRWLTGAVKDNSALAFAVLTGVQRISKESIFSDLNNLVVNTALNVASDERFGFTEAEVGALSEYLGASRGLAEARAWYDGYRFGGVDIYNPWSVLNYIQSGCVPDVYWGNTSSNAVLGDLTGRSDARTLQRLYDLMEPGGTVDESLDLSVVFPDGERASKALWSMLYLAGYLTTDDTAFPNNTRRRRPLRIPNAEIRELYRTEILERFTQVAGGRDHLDELHEAFGAGNAESVAAAFESILVDSASYFDLTSENSYHMLMLGLLFGMPGYNDPLSNRESGRGRFDILLVPCEGSAKPVVVIELKYARKAFSGELSDVAEEALVQIRGRDYARAAVNDSTQVYCYGIACSGKAVAVVLEEVPRD